MSKSEPPPEASESSEQFVRQVFTDLHRAIIEQEPGVINGDIEAVHAMRVAIRRLRVALSNFAVFLPRQDRRRLRDRLENLAEVLGGVRDLDVMIQALKLNRPTRPTGDRPAINSLIRRLQRHRRIKFQLLGKYLQGEEYIEFKHEFSSTEPESETQKNQSSDRMEHGQAA